ncbi:MAG: hypothetical protein ABFD25_06195 [Clostridiaceae bacterium]
MNGDKLIDWGGCGMKFSVGYKFFDKNDDPLAESLCKTAESIEEMIE